jgi:hypothetical protein
MCLNWFFPLPPVRSAIANYTVRGLLAGSDVAEIVCGQHKTTGNLGLEGCVTIDYMAQLNRLTHLLLAKRWF